MKGPACPNFPVEVEVNLVNSDTLQKWTFWGLFIVCLLFSSFFVEKGDCFQKGYNSPCLLWDYICFMLGYDSYYNILIKVTILYNL